MNKDWKPTEYDIEWTKEVLRSIKVGGAWGTSYALYFKTKEKEVQLDKIIWEAQERGFNVEENLRKTAIAIQKCGYTYTEVEGVRNR